MLLHVCCKNLQCLFHMPETVCGSARLKGPLDENGTSPILLRRVEINLCDGNPIVIRCQLIRTNLSVNYVKKLRIYFTSLRDNEELVHQLGPGDWKYQNVFHEEPVGSIINYAFNITVDPRLNRSIITCGAGYQPIPRKAYHYCYTGSAVLIILQDSVSCNSITTSKSPIPLAPITSQIRAVSDKSIVVNEDIFFPVISTAIVVGIILLVANGIQLWVIIIIVKNRRRAKASNISATNGIALAHLGVELAKPHGNEVEQHGTESDSTTIQRVDDH